MFLNTEPIQVLFCQITTDTTLRQIQTFIFHLIPAAQNWHVEQSISREN